MKTGKLVTLLTKTSTKIIVIIATEVTMVTRKSVVTLGAMAA
jgi:hypothetical protein